MNIIEYCTEEVKRQGHTIKNLDGIQRVGWMLEAWSYALQVSSNSLLIGDVLVIGRMIEPAKNEGGFRTVPVWVGSKPCLPAIEISSHMETLFRNKSALNPFEFYRALLEIHPFIDGNGRSAKVVLNWLNGTLLTPVFPPNDFWGYPIRNP